MPELLVIGKVMIYALMAVSLFWAVGVVAFRSLFRSALALAGVLIGVAGVYLTLRADFLAVVQILIYVGSVITMIIFAIMLTERLTDTKLAHRNSQSPQALALVLVFLGFLIWVILNTPWPLVEWLPGQNDLTAAHLGEALLGFYVFPFEVLAVILTAVLIGAIVIARKDKTC